MMNKWMSVQIHNRKRVLELSDNPLIPEHVF